MGRLLIRINAYISKIKQKTILDILETPICKRAPRYLSVLYAEYKNCHSLNNLQFTDCHSVNNLQYTDCHSVNNCNSGPTPRYLSVLYAEKRLDLIIPYLIVNVFNFTRV